MNDEPGHCGGTGMVCDDSGWQGEVEVMREFIAELRAELEKRT